MFNWLKIQGQGKKFGMMAALAIGLSFLLGGFLWASGLHQNDRSGTGVPAAVAQAGTAVQTIPASFADLAKISARPW